jgi:hypothetical protein
VREILAERGVERVHPAERLPIATRCRYSRGMNTTCRMKITLLTVLALLAVPASAHALLLTGDGAAFVRSIPNTMPAPAGDVEVRLGGCPGEPDAAACWVAEWGAIYISDTANMIAPRHELGHVFDARNLDDRERAMLAPWLVRGATAATWGACGDPHHMATYARGRNACAREMFAEAYAGCAARALPARTVTFRRRGVSWTQELPEDNMWQDGYGWSPSLKHVCALIRVSASPVV